MTGPKCCMFKTTQSMIGFGTCRIAAFLDNMIVPQIYHQCSKKQFIQPWMLPKAETFLDLEKSLISC